MNKVLVMAIVAICMVLGGCAQVANLSMKMSGFNKPVTHEEFMSGKPYKFGDGNINGMTMCMKMPTMNLHVDGGQTPVQTTKLVESHSINHPGPSPMVHTNSVAWLGNGNCEFVLDANNQRIKYDSLYSQNTDVWKDIANGSIVGVGQFYQGGFAAEQFANGNNNCNGGICSSPIPQQPALPPTTIHLNNHNINDLASGAGITVGQDCLDDLCGD